jgi:hypothetical protein
MKYIKTYEEKTWEEIYGIIPGENVIIKDEELKNIFEYEHEYIWSSFFNLKPIISKSQLKNKYLPKFFKNKVGKFIDYEKDNGFFCTVLFTFGEKTLKLKTPVYMLVQEYKKEGDKYNL